MSPPIEGMAGGFPLTAISLFTGAGGLDIGFIRSGFDIRLCIETDTSAVATLKANGFNPVWQADIADEQLVTPEGVLQKAKLGPGELGIVIGGPPCQPFSNPGRRGGLNDPRGALIRHFARLVRGLGPRAFVFENVLGILTKPMRAAFDLLEAMLGATSDLKPQDQYQMQVGLLDASDYGVPQVRKRTFVVGWCGPGFFYFPRPTHYRPDKPSDKRNAPKLRRCPTVGDALKGLPQPDPPSKIALGVAASIAARNRKWYGK